MIFQISPPKLIIDSHSAGATSNDDLDNFDTDAKSEIFQILNEGPETSADKRYAKQFDDLKEFERRGAMV